MASGPFFAVAARVLAGAVVVLGYPSCKGSDGGGAPSPGSGGSTTGAGGAGAGTGGTTPAGTGGATNPGTGGDPGAGGSPGAGGGPGTGGNPGASSIPPGFGTDTPAGRGGAVIKVTTLAASGPGSLDAAIRTAGPRIIVFEVGGIIDLNLARLTISEPFVTIAGQT